MDESELKAAFAAFLLETPNEPFVAALKLYPAEKDRGTACRITFAWPSDPIVILEMERLRKDGKVNRKIPDKEQLAEFLWEVAQHERTLPKDKKALGELLAQMLGFIAKSSDDEDSKRMPTQPVYKVVNE